MRLNYVSYNRGKYELELASLTIGIPGQWNNGHQRIFIFSIIPLFHIPPVPDRVCNNANK